MRHDRFVMRDVAKRYGDQALVDQLQHKPFFFIPPEVEAEFTSDSKLNATGFRQIKPEYFVSVADVDRIENLLPFRNFTIMDHEIGWSWVVYLGNNQWSIMQCMDRQTLDMINLDLRGVLMENHLTILSGINTNGSLSIEADLYINFLVDKTTNTIPGISDSVAITLNEMSVDKKVLTSAVASIGQNLEYFLSYFAWAESKHLVQVRNKPTKQDLKTVKHGNKKPWTRNDLPHYIYLDAPQTEKDHPSERSGTGHAVRGHRRRAHWKTLRHPRFKNHPLYGVEKGIRIRDTWVGPQEWVVNNTVYTVQGVNDDFSL